MEMSQYDTLFIAKPYSCSTVLLKIAECITFFFQHTTELIRQIALPMRRDCVEQRQPNAYGAPLSDANL